ncbi:MAG: 3-phosphoserine/phosphohydroxythreonine transaminase [Betaproteobacteria bacterium]|nr:3-phosphoserine/phosphohydroxythreonine transaminase [Betaproteobacteria bacterium]
MNDTATTMTSRRDRVFNFSPGPAMLPTAVLERIRDELLDWNGTGCGVMEVSHRGKEFTALIDRARADLAALLGIPENYRILFLQGGATQQFAQIPLNLLPAGNCADYLVTGAWSQKALNEARRVAGNEVVIRCAGSTASENFTRIPRRDEIDAAPEAAYFHLCTNETIHGVEVFDEDDLFPSGTPLIADMSSHLLSRPIEVSRYGLIYAGAQKNIGPAGLCIVIVRDDLIGRARPGIPALFDYAVQAENDSMLNTPPTFAIYAASLVFQWLLEQGGLPAIEEINREKARRLYAAIDDSGGFYHNPVAPEVRSRMNVPFTLADTALEPSFIGTARESGLLALKGHKSVGGIRASIYNAMPLEGIDALIDFMRDFQKRFG